MFICFTWVVDEIWNSYVEQDIESYTGYQTMLLAVGDYLSKHPKEEWPDIIKKTSKRYDLPLNLMPQSEMSEQKYHEHNKIEKDNTHVFYYDKKVTLHHVLADSDQILTLGPTRMPSRPRAEALVRLIVFGLLGVMIFFWLWPISRDLDQLQKTTKAFGEGDFEIKSDKATSHMIEPMVTAFNMMADRIKSLIEAHKELTNAVAHELRTPLARSKFALQMLSSVKDEAKRERYLAQITTDVGELDELINEMLLYASFSNTMPELKVERQDMVDLVNQQVKKYEQYQGQIEVIKSANGLYADCDYHFIERAVHNYISNAIKYGKDHIRVTIMSENNQCVIKVEDNGKGVSKEFQSVVFDAFSRGDNSRNKETGGFGLGLAIVGRIMEWHKGAATVTDSELGGASFVLTWPLTEQKQLS